MYMAEENTVLDFQQFIDEVKAGVQEFYPDADIRVTPTEKNNGLVLTGLTIMEPGKRVTPTIYLNGPYQSYREGATLAELTAEVADAYRKNSLEEDPEIPDMTDFEAVKDLICFRLINREQNRERLEKMPHRDFLDLAIIYFVPVTVGVGTGGSITINDYMFRLWQTDEETVYRYALENTKRLYPAALQSMEDVIREMMGDDAPAGLFSEKNGVPAIPLYVLRCYRGDMSSAAAMLYGDMLREFGQEHGNFYILPSSIYEVLLMPAGPGPADASFVCPVVRDVNQAQVAPDEVLSDNAYYYHADTGEIEILS